MSQNLVKNPSCWSIMARSAAFCVLIAAVLAGCGGETLSPVTGKVTFNGEPVRGGTIIFGPSEGTKGGTPASAEVKEDGTYELKAGATVGAVAGKNKVMYTPPPGKPSTDPKKEGEPSPYAGLVPVQKEVEVKPGPNVINIELEPAPKKKGV